MKRLRPPRSRVGALLHILVNTGGTGLHGWGCCAVTNVLGRRQMQRTLMLAAAAATALTLAACNRQSAGNTAAANAAANPGQSAPVNAAQDAVGAAVGQTSASTLG